MLQLHVQTVVSLGMSSLNLNWAQWQEPSYSWISASVVIMAGICKMRSPERDLPSGVMGICPLDTSPQAVVVSPRKCWAEVWLELTRPMVAAERRSATGRPAAILGLRTA